GRVVLAVDDDAAADAAVAAVRTRAAAFDLQVRGAGAVHQAAAASAACASSCAIDTSDSHTNPSRSSTAYRRAQPTSGAQAWPLPRSMFQPCSGQVTLSPLTMPCDSGPPLCGQRSASANT